MNLSSRTKGVLCILLSALCFSCMSVCVRMAGELPTFEKAFFRNIVAAVLVYIIVLRRRTPLRVPRNARLFVLLRCVFGTMGIILNFYAIDRLNLADANMLNKLSPFFAILFSYFILKEKVRPIQAALVVGAFLGSLLIIKPSGSNLQLLPALGGFFGGLSAGAAYTCLRKSTSLGVMNQLVVLYFSVFSCLITLPFIAMNFVMPTGKQLITLILCGMFGAGGQTAITAAYTYAPAREISLYDYFQVLFGAVLGFFFFDQLPDVFSFLGYGVILVMAVANFLYNNRQHRESQTANPNQQPM